MNQLIELLDERILILDGAMGTLLQGYQFEEEDFRGDRFKDHPRSVKGNNDLLSITQSGTVKEVHRGFLEAGADIISTNTFNRDRKSTRLNSSHVASSYAVFCLKKTNTELGSPSLRRT